MIKKQEIIKVMVEEGLSVIESERIVESKETFKQALQGLIEERICDLPLEELEQKKFFGLINNLENPYPEDVFLKLELEEWQRDKLDSLLKSNFGFGIDRFSAELMRRSWNNCKEKLKQEVRNSSQA